MREVKEGWEKQQNRKDKNQGKWKKVHADGGHGKRDLHKKKYDSGDQKRKKSKQIKEEYTGKMTENQSGKYGDDGWRERGRREGGEGG